MTEPRDPLLDTIHEAGRVPPPPGRDAAFARAMRAVFMPSRRRLGRSVIALFAAALLAAPAAVFAAHETRQHAAVVRPIVSERPDPGSSIHTEADDTTLKRTASAGSHEASETAPSAGDSREGQQAETQQQSGDSTTAGGTDGSDRSGSGESDGGVSSPSPTPAPSETQSSSSDGGSSGSDGGTSPTGDDSTSGPH